MDINDQIQQAAKLISRASNIVALTGAGISTPSGIPDFRSSNSGLWDEVDPLSVASIYAFRRNPQRFYDWIHSLSHLVLEAKPNAAHFALAELEHQGKLKAVVTQNIDNLHQKAGSKTVHELHGHLRKFTCIRCYRVQDSNPILEKFIEDKQVPRCSCGRNGVLKPNVTLFGEQLPVQPFVAAQAALSEADLVIITGSSLEVAPVSDLPEVALKNGASLIIINYQPTYLDSSADVLIRGDVAEVLPGIIDLVTV